MGHGQEAAFEGDQTEAVEEHLRVAARLADVDVGALQVSQVEVVLEGAEPDLDVGCGAGFEVLAAEVALAAEVIDAPGQVDGLARGREKASKASAPAELWSGASKLMLKPGQVSDSEPAKMTRRA